MIINFAVEVACVSFMLLWISMRLKKWVRVSSDFRILNQCLCFIACENALSCKTYTNMESLNDE